jgi:pyruvate ferredoxin oxidoreductase delta subunit
MSTDTRKSPRKKITASSTPARGEAGRTGDWRVRYPVIDNEKCTPARTGKESCFACWALCPEAVISRTIPLEIDLEYCKGCAICAEECPVDAITMIGEE